MKTEHVTLKVQGRDLIAEIAFLQDGAMVAIKSICEAIGIAANMQREKIKNDPRFKWYDNISVAEDGKNREMFSIPAHQVGPWLYTINANKVKKEARQALLEFQLHLTQELHAIISGRISSAETVELKKEVAELKAQNKEMSLQMRHLIEIVMTMKSEAAIKDVVVEQEEVLASVGGKLLNRARATKSMRNIYKH